MTGLPLVLSSTGKLHAETCLRHGPSAEAVETAAWKRPAEVAAATPAHCCHPGARLVAVAQISAELLLLDIGLSTAQLRADQLTAAMLTDLPPCERTHADD